MHASYIDILITIKPDCYLIESKASNTPEVMVICLLSNTTTPISSIGLVTSDIRLNPSGKALFFPPPAI